METLQHVCQKSLWPLKSVQTQIINALVHLENKNPQETDRLVKDYSNRVGLKTRDQVKKKKLTSGKCTMKPPHTHEYGYYK